MRELLRNIYRYIYRYRYILNTTHAIYLLVDIKSYSNIVYLRLLLLLIETFSRIIYIWNYVVSAKYIHIYNRSSSIYRGLLRYYKKCI